MDSKDQNLDLTRTKRIHFCLFQSIFVCWVRNARKKLLCVISRLWRDSIWFNKAAVTTQQP